ncbi:MAG TPA: cytochrome c oxidase assembly protein [Devosiaceae bacterium]|nr:cytochrome c oxidase assembly protein [Devosiaceae bacterium]
MVQRPQQRHDRAGWLLTGAGAAVLIALWAGPLPALSRTAFAAHMILHLGVISLAAPLLALGMVRLGLGRAVLPPVLAAAIFATLFDLAVVWGWHLPVLHEAAARVPALFAAQQASFLLAGVAVWVTALGSGEGGGGFLGGLLALLFTGMHMTMLGVLLLAAPVLLYDPSLCVGILGFERLDDQRLGGVLMASFGGLPYLAGGLFLVARMLRPRETGG